jgi:hypothetical protein
MSRTIRRKGKDVNPKAKDGYTLTDKYVEVYRGRKFSSYTGKFYDDYGFMPVKRFPLPEKEYWKGYWTFYGDNYHFGHTKMYRDDWGDVRTKNRNNLVRHLREDAECFFWEDVNTKDWD